MHVDKCLLWLQGKGLATSHQALDLLMAQEALEPAGQEPEPGPQPPALDHRPSQAAPRAAALSWSTRPPTAAPHPPQGRAPASAAVQQLQEQPVKQPAAQQQQQQQQQQQEGPEAPAQPLISLEEACSLLESGRTLPVERGLVERLMGIVEAGTSWQAAALALTDCSQVDPLPIRPSEGCFAAAARARPLATSLAERGCGLSECCSALTSLQHGQSGAQAFAAEVVCCCSRPCCRDCASS